MFSTLMWRVQTFPEGGKQLLESSELLGSMTHRRRPEAVGKITDSVCNATLWSTKSVDLGG